MSDKTYRVIQWMTGDVGQVGVRHFADPEVGAVTAYIKEGSRPANYMNRFIAYEYVNAQAGARRAQNVLGALLTASIFLGTSNASTVQPVVDTERSVFYRCTPCTTLSR